MGSTGAGERGAPHLRSSPSGATSYAYLARVSYPEERGVVSPVWQAVCSPFRNALSTREERIAQPATRGSLRRSAAHCPLGRRQGRAWSGGSSSRRPSTIQLTLDIDGDRVELRIEARCRATVAPAEARTSLARELTREARATVPAVSRR